MNRQSDSLCSCIAKCFALVLLCLSFSACESNQDEVIRYEHQRLITPLNLNWQFTLLEAGYSTPKKDEEWKDIALPHTWNARDGQDGGDDYFRGTGVYRRDFTLDDRLAGRRLFLHFDGAAISTQVYVNDQLAGVHKGSYGAFRFDISDMVKPGENRLEVRVNNEPDENVAPLSADFTFFGGLYREARIIATDVTHIEATNHASSGVFWTQKAVSDLSATVTVDAVITNAADRERVLTIEAKVLDASGNLVSAESGPLTMAARQRAPVTLILNIQNPRLWHGRRDPYLYRGQLIVSEAGQPIDTVEEAIGIRYFHIDKDRGFFLNGEHYPLRGINRMPDFLDKGTAVSREDHERDIQLMLEMGANSIRLGHQQRDSWVYQRADEVGLVVWAEIPLINRIQDNAEFSTNLEQQTRELIRQNYNRPSIAIWGIYNEITLKQGPDPRSLVQQLHQLVKAEDSSRLTSAAVAAEGGLDDPLVTTPDTISFNRYDGWYYGTFDTFAEFLDELRHTDPELTFGISEYGAGAGPSIQTEQPRIQDHSEQYQALYHEAYWQAMKVRPWVWGPYIWVLADFAVDNRNEGETAGRNDKGLVSYDRQVKKDAFHFYKANWSDEPVLHIADRRHAKRIRGIIDIKVYSNLDLIELTVNGESQGLRTPDDIARTNWQNVPLRMGENLIIATGRRGEQTLTDQITLSRVVSDETDISSTYLGIDNKHGKIYNAPPGIRLDDLATLLTTPEQSTLSIVGNTDANLLHQNSVVRVTAQNGKSHRDYQLAQAPLSVGKPVWASSEIAGGLSIGPLDIPEMSASMANDGIVVRDPDQGLTDANLWNTMGGSKHWWKVDLGTGYHLDSIEIVWPQHSTMLKEGSMSYSVEVADDFSQTFDEFAESYSEIVDLRNNQRTGTTVDVLDTRGRYVQVRLHESSIFADNALAGSYPIYGAEEITVYGGLLHSDQLAIDYRDRSIAAPDQITVAQLQQRLSVVNGGSLEILDDKAQPATHYAVIQSGYQVIAQDKSNRLSEAYSIR